MKKLLVLRPIKSNRKTQDFGAKRACIKVDIVNGSPRPSFPQKIVGKRGSKVCPTGYLDLYTWYLGVKGHPGEDWGAYRGEPLYFSADFGTGWYAKGEADVGVRLDVYSQKRVYFSTLPSQAGPEAQQEWKDNNGMMYVKFVHAHLKDILWANEKVVGKDGEEHPLVKFGWQTGWCNNTGLSSGDHLHWNMKFTDRHDRTLDKNNGYHGAVDFRECCVFRNEFVGIHIQVKRIMSDVISLQERIISLLKRIILKHV